MEPSKKRTWILVAIVAMVFVLGAPCFMCCIGPMATSMLFPSPCQAEQRECDERCQDEYNNDLSKFGTYTECVSDCAAQAFDCELESL